MAGYFVYSFDWDLFQEFINQPSDDQLEKFSAALDDEYESLLDVFEEDDEDDTLVKSWSSDGKDPVAAIRKHLKRDDWYSGLGQLTCRTWSNAIEAMVQDFDFRVDSDGIYWPLIELAVKQIGKESDQHAVARFGRCPYSLKAIEPFEPKEWGFDWWDPYHSMHPPKEVQQLLQEIESLHDTVMESKDQQTIEDYEELVPALKAIANDGRVLYISVDT